MRAGLDEAGLEEQGRICAELDKAGQDGGRGLERQGWIREAGLEGSNFKIRSFGCHICYM
jgi:hypothetical protein